MRRTLLSVLVILFAAGGLFVGTGPAFADDEGHGKSVEQVEAEIRTELGLKADERIDPDKVPPALLEELGDAVMGVMHPDPEQQWNLH